MMIGLRTSRLIQILVLCFWVVAVSFVISSCAAQEITDQPPVQDGIASPDGVGDAVEPDRHAGPNEDDVDTSADLEDETYLTEERLLAEVSDYAISLYANIDDGVVLHWGEQVASYDWLYMTPRGIGPNMAVRDYDGDEAEELAVDLYIGSGTGVSVDELHIVERGEDGLTDHKYEAERYIEQLRRDVALQVYVNAAEQLIGEVTIGDASYQAVIPDIDPGAYASIPDVMVIGNIVSFSLEEDGIKAQFGLGVEGETPFDIIYFGDLNADVVYRAGEFELVNITFEQI